MLFNIMIAALGLTLIANLTLLYILIHLLRNTGEFQKKNSGQKDQ